MFKGEYSKKEDALKPYQEESTQIWMDDVYKHLNGLPTVSFPEELSEDGTLTVHVKDGSKVSRVLVWGDNIFGGLYYPDSAEGEENDEQKDIL